MEETGSDRVEDLLIAAWGPVAWKSAYQFDEDGDDFVIRIPNR